MTSINKFGYITSDRSTISSLQQGTSDLHLDELKLDNLLANMPVKSNAVGELISSNIEISEVNGLTTALGDITGTDFDNRPNAVLTNELTLTTANINGRSITTDRATLDGIDAKINQSLLTTDDVKFNNIELTGGLHTYSTDTTKIILDNSADSYRYSTGIEDIMSFDTLNNQNISHQDHVIEGSNTLDGDLIFNNPSEIKINNNSTTALAITDTNGGFINIDSTNGEIKLERNTTVDADLTLTNNGTATMNGTSISSTQWGYLGGLDQTLDTTATPSFESLTVNQVGIDNGVITYSGATGANEIVIPDTLTDGLSIRDSTNDYMVFNTTDTKIEVKQALDISGDVNGTSISDTQWGYVGAMNQSVATTDDVAFNQINVGVVERVQNVINPSVSGGERYTLIPNMINKVSASGNPPANVYLEISNQTSGTVLTVISSYNDTLTLRIVKATAAPTMYEIQNTGFSDYQKTYADDSDFYELPRFSCVVIHFHGENRFSITECARPRALPITRYLGTLGEPLDVYSDTTFNGNVGGASISSTQWGYLGGLDQSIATTDSVTFESLTVNQVGIDNSVITYSGATGTNEIVFPSSQANGLSIKTTANDFIIFDSTTSDNNIDIKVPVFLSDRVFYNTRSLSVATAYVYLAGDYHLLCDPSSGSLSYQLPNTTSLSGDIQLTFKNTTTSTNIVSITAGGSDTIDGSTSITINTAYQSYTLISDILNTAWYII